MLHRLASIGHSRRATGEDEALRRGPLSASFAPAIDTSRLDRRLEVSAFSAGRFAGRALRAYALAFLTSTSIGIFSATGAAASAAGGTEAPASTAPGREMTIPGPEVSIPGREVAAPGRVDATHAPVADTSGGRMEPLPDDLAGIGITEHPDTLLPLDLEFTDESGRAVRLRDYFDGRRPVVLNLVYYTCPMLCTLVVNGVVEAMNEIGLTQGRDFVNVVVSIDPSETPALAQAKKSNYLRTYRKEVTGQDWHFLVGRQAEITALAEAVGFGYRYDAESNEFIHTACTFVCTPDGRVSRYLYGIQYETQTFRLALLEAAQGRIGTTVDRLILYCYHYDASSGRYAPAALRIVQVGGLLTAVAVGLFLLALWAGDRRRARLLKPSGAES